MINLKQQALIDKFLVPEDAIHEFKKNTKININFIRKLPGFINETAYERTVENRNLVYITDVVWKDEDAIKKARSDVQTEFKRLNFNRAEMMERLHITLD